MNDSAMSDSADQALSNTGANKTQADQTQQLTLPQTAEPQLQGQKDAHPGHLTPHLQQAPESAQNRGEDAVDVASMGSMITSDPPSSLMPEDQED
jgi:hypothetical protein